ncbi:MAG: hypothetical protein ACT4P9_13090 [Betaproteobacteria bacterium]
MEWLAGIYLVVGVFKTIARLGHPNPGKRPAWLALTRNPLVRAVYFTMNVFFWPFLRTEK